MSRGRADRFIDTIVLNGSVRGTRAVLGPGQAPPGLTAVDIRHGERRLMTAGAACLVETFRAPGVAAWEEIAFEQTGEIIGPARIAWCDYRSAGEALRRDVADVAAGTGAVLLVILCGAILAILMGSEWERALGLAAGCFVVAGALVGSYAAVTVSRRGPRRGATGPGRSAFRSFSVSAAGRG